MISLKLVSVASSALLEYFFFAFSYILTQSACPQLKVDRTNFDYRPLLQIPAGTHLINSVGDLFTPQKGEAAIMAPERLRLTVNRPSPGGALPRLELRLTITILIFGVFDIFQYSLGQDGSQTKKWSQ